MKKALTITALVSLLIVPAFAFNMLSPAMNENQLQGDVRVGWSLQVSNLNVEGNFGTSNLYGSVGITAGSNVTASTALDVYGQSMFTDNLLLWTNKLIKGLAQTSESASGYKLVVVPDTFAQKFITSDGGTATYFVVTGTLKLPGVPTSTNGLSAGDVWCDSGILKLKD